MLRQISRQISFLETGHVAYHIYKRQRKTRTTISFMIYPVTRCCARVKLFLPGICPVAYQIKGNKKYNNVLAKLIIQH